MNEGTIYVLIFFRLFDWRPEKNPFQRAKHERIVILKNMFDLQEFDVSNSMLVFCKGVQTDCS